MALYFQHQNTDNTFIINHLKTCYDGYFQEEYERNYEHGMDFCPPQWLHYERGSQLYLAQFQAAFR